MTRRSLILGLVCASLVAGFSGLNDFAIRQNFLIPNLMPIVLYGGLVLVVFLLNPLLVRRGRGWSLTGPELAVIAAFVLAACFVPGRGLLHCMPTSIMLPHHYARTTPGWESEGVIQTCPPQMLADVSQNEDAALNGYIMGLGKGDRHASPAEVPWFAWRRTLAFWVPLILSLALGSIGLAVVVHPQWARHEQLAYPISTFAHALLPAEGQAGESIFRNRLFQVSALAVLAVHLNNYACEWWPDALIRITRNLDFTPLAAKLPALVRGGGWMYLRPLVIFSVIGISYFLASEVSFTLGVLPFAFCVISGVLASHGVPLRAGHHLSLKLESFLFAGGYCGIMLMAIYTGRFYYWQVLRRSLFLRAPDRDIPPECVLGMRVFLAGTLLFIVQLVLIGLDWYLACLYAGITIMIYIVVSRTIAEAGAYFIGSEVFPCAIIWGFFGSAALGPKAMVIMSMVSVVLLAGPGWAAMPFMVQAFKLVDLSGVKVSRTAAWGAGVVVLSLIIALPLTLYWQYDRGVFSASDGWGQATPRFPFDNIVTVKQTLAAQGRLGQAETVHGLARLAHLEPTWPCVASFGIACLLAIVIAAGRLRFRWWPFHPVIFVFLGGYQAMVMAGSFLLGWLVKTAVLSYGGARLYQRLKPLMIGLIAGDMVAGLVPMIVGAVYYFTTGDLPKNYWISYP